MQKLTAIPVLAGPTAVGKTAISLDLAEIMGAEIVSADSRQIYSDFKIGTARPLEPELSRISHHFVPEYGLDQDYSAGRFAAAATERIPDIQARGKNVVITGGSTLYVHALIEGLSDIPFVEPTIRERLNHRLEEEGPDVLHAELVLADPAFAATLDASKTQRIIRGLEVFEGTGMPLSSFHTPPPLPNQTFRLIILHRPRQQLYERIDQRVEAMMASGLLREVEQLMSAGADVTGNAFRTIGYQELIPAITGEYPIEEAVRLIKRNSRRYAKRQLTWYRRYPDAQWIDVGERETSDIAGEILASLRD